MQAMPWDAVREMVNALDFDTIAEPEDDYILPVSYTHLIQKRCQDWITLAGKWVADLEK